MARRVMQRRRLAALAASLVLQAGLPILPELLPPILPGGPPVPGEPLTGVRAVSTGEDSERLRTLPIARRRARGMRSVMSLPPRRVGTLRTGDELRLSAEVQVSTTCVDRSSRCQGRRYRFNPRVSARLVLARSAKSTGDDAGALSEWRSVRCSQRRPNRNHHCVIVFPQSRSRIEGKALPCPPAACRVNLIVSGQHPRAKRRTKLVVGGDSPGRRISQDKGRINLVRIRPEAQARVGITQRTAGSASLSAEGARRVIASTVVEAPRPGDVIETTGSARVGLGGLPHNALVQSELIVALDPEAVYPGPARGAVTHRGRLSELNGFNCTRGPSGFRSPCLVVKAGLGRVREKARELLLPGQPLYVNLVSRARPVLTNKRFRNRLPVRKAQLRVVHYGGG